MSRTRTGMLKPLLSGALILTCLCLVGRVDGQTREVAGLITEIKLSGGTVEVQPTGTNDWRPAGPLMSLMPGDTVRASGAGSAVVLLTGGRGTILVDASSGLVMIPNPPPTDSTIQRARTLLGTSLTFLSTRAKELPKTILGTRSVTRPPVVLAPRDGPMLADSLTFDWVGDGHSRYTVQIVTASSLVLERKGVTGRRLEYPPDGPSLTPGVRYTFRVLSDRYPPQDAWFEVLSVERSAGIRQNLASLDQETGGAVSANTLAALRAGLLAEIGLSHEARLLLLTALARDPGEPTLHLLLGNLYARSGLSKEAGESFDEARFLLSDRVNR